MKIRSKSSKGKKLLLGKFWPPLLFGIVIYLGLLALRIYGEALFSRTYQGPAQQLIIIVYVLVSLFVVWGFKQEFSNSKSWSKNPLLKRKFLLYNVIATAIIVDYIINDQNSGWSRPLFSVLYDVTFILSMLLLFFFVLSFVIFGFRRKKTFSKNEPSEGYRFNTNSSLGKQGEDKLNREGFARHLAWTVEQHASSNNDRALTIGLYGPWGSGKTSIFDLMEKQLEESNNSIIVRFQPWFFGKDYMNLIPEFLKKLIDSIKEHSTDYNPGLIRDLKAYQKLLTPITLHPPGLNINLKDFSQNNDFSKDYMDAEDMRIQIVERIKSAKIKLIVFIDDLDRLDNKEIQMVFKLVRLIADFPNTTYIIAMDERIVVDSLAQMYSKEFEKDVGKQYLEKFIQVPLYIPKSDPNLLSQLGWEQLEPILKAEEVTIEQGHVIETLNLMEISPRNSERLSNLLQVYLPLLKKEVYPLDLINLLAIKVSKPSLYEFILKNEEGFIGTGKKQLEVREALKSSYEPYYNFLIKMFPLIMGDRPLEKDPLELQKRIGSSEHFWTYFMYSVPSDKLSESDLDRFYVAIEQGDSQAKEVEKFLIGKSSIITLHKKLRGKIESSEISENWRLYRYFTDKFYTYYNKSHVQPQYYEGQTLIALFEFLYIKSKEPLVDLFAENPTNLALLGRVYDQYKSIEPLKQEIKEYLSKHFTYLLWKEHSEIDKNSIFHAWWGTASEEEKQIKIGEITNQNGLKDIINYLISDVITEDIGLVNSYINVLEYVPMSVIKKELSGIAKITSYNDIYRGNKESDSRLKMLSYMHNNVYNTAHRLLTEIYDNGGKPQIQFSKDIDRLCELGESENIENIRNLHHEIKSLIKEKECNAQQS